MASKQLPRHLLPQIPSDKISEFVDFVRLKGYGTSKGKVPTNQLRPAQNYVNKEKVEWFKAHPEKIIESPILVSQGGWILDGHHREIAFQELYPDKEIDCLIFECPINKLISLGHLFDHSFRKGLDENYSKRLWNEMVIRKTLVPPDFKDKG